MLIVIDLMGDDEEVMLAPEREVIDDKRMVIVPHAEPQLIEVPVNNRKVVPTYR